MSLRSFRDSILFGRNCLSEVDILSNADFEKFGQLFCRTLSSGALHRQASIAAPVNEHVVEHIRIPATKIWASVSFRHGSSLAKAQRVYAVPIRSTP
jgi:hypothetical protein